MKKRVREMFEENVRSIGANPELRAQLLRAVVGGRDPGAGGHGEAVRDLRHLGELRKQRRSVWAPSGGMLAKPRPAAFAMCLQAEIVLRLFEMGLYVWERQPKTSRGWSPRANKREN